MTQATCYTILVISQHSHFRKSRQKKEGRGLRHGAGRGESFRPRQRPGLGVTTEVRERMIKKSITFLYHSRCSNKHLLVSNLSYQTSYLAHQWEKHYRYCVVYCKCVHLKINVRFGDYLYKRWSGLCLVSLWKKILCTLFVTRLLFLCIIFSWLEYLKKLGWIWLVKA